MWRVILQNMILADWEYCINYAIILDVDYLYISFLLIKENDTFALHFKQD